MAHGRIGVFTVHVRVRLGNDCVTMSVMPQQTTSSEGSADLPAASGGPRLCTLAMAPRPCQVHSGSCGRHHNHIACIGAMNANAVLDCGYHKRISCSSRRTSRRRSTLSKKQVLLRKYTVGSDDAGENMQGFVYPCYLRLRQLNRARSHGLYMLSCPHYTAKAMCVGRAVCFQQYQ
jgi:hypothetical protein